VKQIFNTSWKPVKEAPPSTPVWVTGLSEIPDAGEKFLVVDDLADAQQRAEAQRLYRRQKELATRRRKRASLDSLFSDLEAGAQKELRLIIKADVAGSLEAIKGEVRKLAEANPDVTVTILHAAAGGITEGDITLADASDAIIIGFHVTAEERARVHAKARHVEVRTYSVIYQILDDLKAAMEGLLEPEQVEEIIGHAEVRQIFKAPKVGTIAGCYVTQGLVQRNARVRLLRDNVVVYTGELDSLKRFKDDVREVREGMECGLSIQNYNDIMEGDVLEFFLLEEVKRTL